jgi:hypothetical protein
VRSTDQAGSGEWALRSVRLDPLPRPRQRLYLVNAIVSAGAGEMIRPTVIATLSASSWMLEGGWRCLGMFTRAVFCSGKDLSSIS